MAMPRVLCRVRLLIHNDYSVISKYSTVVNSVSINKCAQFRHSIRHFRTNFSAGLVLNFSQKQDKEDHRHIASSSSDSDSTDSEDDVELKETGIPIKCVNVYCYVVPERRPNPSVERRSGCKKSSIKKFFTEL
ncbi:hypothetical protein MTP99_010011 [Tenebrio molitor]|nr:hypothetical protein MTP99_010011 [Tenebrio molitor]